MTQQMEACSCAGVMQDLLIKAVVKRLMSDAPLGVLLSGGLDSSLVAAIAMRCVPQACMVPQLPQV